MCWVAVGGFLLPTAEWQMELVCYSYSRGGLAVWPHFSHPTNIRMGSTLEEPTKAPWARRSPVLLQTGPWTAVIRAGVRWKSYPGASEYKAGLKMGGEMWVWGCLNWPIHSSEQPEPIEGVGLFICMHLTFRELVTSQVRAWEVSFFVISWVTGL